MSVVRLKIMSEFNGLSFPIPNITKNNIDIISIGYSDINLNDFYVISISGEFFKKSQDFFCFCLHEMGIIPGFYIKTNQRLCVGHTKIESP